MEEEAVTPDTAEKKRCAVIRRVDLMSTFRSLVRGQSSICCLPCCSDAIEKHIVSSLEIHLLY